MVSKTESEAQEERRLYGSLFLHFRCICRTSSSMYGLNGEASFVRWSVYNTRTDVAAVQLTAASHRRRRAPARPVVRPAVRPGVVNCLTSPRRRRLCPQPGRQRLECPNVGHFPPPAPEKSPSPDPIPDLTLNPNRNTNSVPNNPLLTPNTHPNP